MQRTRISRPRCYSVPAALFAITLLFRFQIVYGKDDPSKSASVLILQQFQNTWYTILLRDRGHLREWDIPGGLAKVGEHRNVAGPRELEEETNRALRVNSKNFDFGHNKPFRNYVEVTKGRNNNHHNITFVARTKTFKPRDLLKIAEQMRAAPSKDGYQEKDGFVFVNLHKLLEQVKRSRYMEDITVSAHAGYTFDYNDNGKAKITRIKKGKKLKFSGIVKRSLAKYMEEFEKTIEEAKKGPAFVQHGFKKPKKKG